MPFSPTQPASMIANFEFVLFLTMIKGAIEDLNRYSQDKQANNQIVLKLYDNKWKAAKCFVLIPGDIIKILKKLFLIHS